MRHLLLLGTLILAGLPAKAEPISFRCDGKYLTEPQPYFMTFDIFERDGGGIISGEILLANDEQLDLSLRGTGGRILLSFDRARKIMNWPGLPAGDLGRSSLHHICTEVTGRTVLSLFYPHEQILDPRRRDPVDAFTISCPGQTGGFYFFTLDRKTRTVVLETEHLARIMNGDITDISGDIISFTFGSGRSDVREARWNGGDRTLTLPAVPGDATRPLTTMQCSAGDPRSIMEIYKERVRWSK